MIDFELVSIIFGLIPRSVIIGIYALEWHRA